jgi:hypothetical protein
MTEIEFTVRVACAFVLDTPQWTPGPQASEQSRP